MSAVAIHVDGLSKRYRLGARQRYRTLRDTLGDAVRAPWRRRAAAAEAEEPGRPTDLWALRDVSFDVEQGHVLGVIGPNGAGKSTLLRILSRVTEPTTGRAEVVGRVGSLIEVGTGFHPELTGRDNVYLSGAILGMRRKEIARKFDEIVAFAEVDRFLDTPVKHYSSGMYLRLGFAVAAHLDPEVLLVDEVLAVGDAAFQRKCLGKMDDVAKGGRTVLFVSHNMTAVQHLCDRALLVEGGRLVLHGDVAGVVHRYLARGLGGNGGFARLEDHPGRTPSMRRLLRSVGIRQPAGSLGYREVLSTGDEMVVEVVYNCGDLALDYAVITITTATGDRVCTVGTHLAPAVTGTLRGKGVLECRIPSLPLTEGEYCLLVAIGTRWPLRNLDEVPAALAFRVEAGDYFGTGQTVLRGQGPLALRSEWRIL